MCRADEQQKNILLALDITRCLYEENTLFHEKTIIKLKRANLNRRDIFNVLSHVENIAAQFLKNVFKQYEKFSIKEKLDKIVALKSKSNELPTARNAENSKKRSRELQVIRQRLVEEVSFIQNSIKECKKVLSDAFEDGSNQKTTKSFRAQEYLPPFSTSPSVMSDSTEEISITSHEEENESSDERKSEVLNNTSTSNVKCSIQENNNFETTESQIISTQKTRVIKKTRSDTFIIRNTTCNKEDKKSNTTDKHEHELKDRTPKSPKRNLWVQSESTLHETNESLTKTISPYIKEYQEKQSRTKLPIKSRTISPINETKLPYSTHKKKLSLDSRIFSEKSRRSFKYEKLKQIDTIFIKESVDTLTKTNLTKPKGKSSQSIGFPITNQNGNLTKSINQSNQKLSLSAKEKKPLNRQFSAPPQKRSPNPLSPSKRRFSLPDFDGKPTPNGSQATWGKRLSLNMNKLPMSLSASQTNMKQKLNLMRVNSLIKETHEEENYNSEYLNEVKTKIIELNSRKTSASSRKLSLTNKNGKIPYIERNLIDRITHAIERDVKNLLIGDPALHHIFKNKDLCFVNLCNPNQTIQIGFNIINHYMDVNAHVNIENYHIMLGYNDIKEKNVTVQDLVADMEYYIKDLHMKLSDSNKIHIYGLVPRFKNHIMNGRLKLFNEQMIIRIRKLKLKQIVYYTRKMKFERDTSF